MDLSLHISGWYKEATSEWTLDYPPLFAWFEWGLSHAAQLFDPAMLEVSNLNHASPQTIIFQRLSVICLLIVDHIHFQYNGFLMGILIWSVALIREGHDLLGALLFAVLLNMKHLFACMGPLYFVYLLHHCCREHRAVLKFFVLGAIVAAVFAASFGPFILAGQLEQVLGRLFPFNRGLMHAYWAANMWALYAAADRALALLLLRLGFQVEKAPGLMTGGLVQVSSFAVLPDIGAGTTLVVVLLSMAPMLISVWRNPRPDAFASAAAYACICSFMAGYHVHEKAILTYILPLSLDALKSRAAARNYLMLSVTGHYALLPLLFTQNEYPLKVLLFGISSLASCELLSECLEEMPPFLRGQAL
ncbi:hypothetical protein WJX75_003352 [Coccomyxa subellipsoidea]|uniref:Alpha-1,3-glucosyltransferase n=1 Tax=Coccomyxa subellipsoidea TaxID=248742 RepID=A0ABR2YD59_9CHLO